jgi:hypothetical protein
MSKTTGFAPTAITALIEAANAKLGIITSSSFEILNVFKARINEAVTLQVDTAKPAPK